MSEFIDLSHPISESTPPFPGDPPVEIEVLQATDQSDNLPRQSVNCSRIAMCIHCGTHVDAPFHFFGNGKTIDQVALEACIGPACLVTLFDDAKAARLKVIEPEHLAPHRRLIWMKRRVILATGWQTRWREADYFLEHPVLSRAAAEWLVKNEVMLVGVDFPSVDQRPNEAHLELLGNGVLILENLTNLDALVGRNFDIIAAPLAFAGRDGSPVRAVARVTQTDAYEYENLAQSWA
jgi:kynurenine formamidase